MKQHLIAASLCLSLSGVGPYAQTGTAPASSNNQQSVMMKEFSLLVRVPVSYTTAQARAVNPEWDSTIEQWKADGVYVTSFAFPGESYVVAGPGKEIRQESVICDQLRVVSNIVLRAADMDDALGLAKACPVLVYGGTVEVREIPKRRVAATD